jgi:hypothetical protein
VGEENGAGTSWKNGGNTVQGRGSAHEPISPGLAPKSMVLSSTPCSVASS